MTGTATPLAVAAAAKQRRLRIRAAKYGITKFSVTMFAASMAMIFLLPLIYMVLTSLKNSDQLTATNAPLYPATAETWTAPDGTVDTVYVVPMPDGSTRQLALVTEGRVKSQMVDPKTGETIEWTGNWRNLTAAYTFSINWDNFNQVFGVLNFPLLLRNTMVVSVLGTIGAVSSAVLVAFGFARFKIPGKNGLFLLLIMTIMLPFQVLLIPQYLAFNSIGWNGTWLPLIIPTFFANAYNVFLLRQYFLTLPRELDEAAQIDGASPLRILISVIIPQAWPAIIAVSLFHFFFSWNDFFAPLVYLTGHTDLSTMTVGLQAFSASYSRASSGILTQVGSLVAMIVPVTIFFFAQRVFMRGVVISGVEK
jgi:multiple sugar transport system permease protein